MSRYLETPTEATRPVVVQAAPVLHPDLEPAELWRLDSPYISTRPHLALEPAYDGWYLRVLGGSRGTATVRVNDELLRSGSGAHRLRPGDSLRPNDAPLDELVLRVQEAGGCETAFDQDGRLFLGGEWVTDWHPGIGAYRVLRRLYDATDMWVPWPELWAAYQHEPHDPAPARQAAESVWTCERLRSVFGDSRLLARLPEDQHRLWVEAAVRRLAPFAELDLARRLAACRDDEMRLWAIADLVSYRTVQDHATTPLGRALENLKASIKLQRDKYRVYCGRDPVRQQDGPTAEPQVLGGPWGIRQIRLAHFLLLTGRR